MVIGNCCPPSSSPGASPDPFTVGIQTAIKSIMEAVDKLSGKRDDEPEEPSSLVSVKKTVTTYEFDAEGVARTLVKTAGAIFRGFRWEEGPSGLPQARVSMPVYPEGESYVSAPDDYDPAPDELLAKNYSGLRAKNDVPADSAIAFARAFSNLATLEGPDGKLKPVFAEAVVATLVGSRPGKEAAMELAASMIQALAPEKHREQLMAELAKLSTQSMEERVKRYQETQAAERAKRDPIITPPPPSADMPAPPAEASKYQPPTSKS